MTQQQLKDLSVRIKKRRKECGYTQEKFSEAIGITLSSYSKIENAFQTPSLDTLINISKNLNISLDYLVYGANKSKPSEITNTALLEDLLENADIEKLSHAVNIIDRICKIKGE